MKPFIFSADSHIMEPADIFLDGLPASLKDHAIHARMEGEYLVTGTKDKIIYRLRVGQHAAVAGDLIAELVTGEAAARCQTRQPHIGLVFVFAQAAFFSGSRLFSRGDGRRAACHRRRVGLNQ